MSTQLCIQVISDVGGTCQELKFFEAAEWNGDSEKQLIGKIQELMNIVRHCGVSFEVKMNVKVNDLNDAVFLIRKKISNTSEIKNHKLSLREIEVLGLIMQGFTNNEIADKLFVCYETVKSHRKNILTKTGSKNTAALINYYHQTFFDK